jgi:mannose/fructose/N-acetylgalactosamine-specific phosphotransferase system component IIC
MREFLRYLFQDTERVKTVIAVGGTIVAAIGFAMVLFGMSGCYFAVD